jgi:hypothetical protein
VDLLRSKIGCSVDSDRGFSTGSVENLNIILSNDCKIRPPPPILGVVTQHKTAAIDSIDIVVLALVVKRIVEL